MTLEEAQARIIELETENATAKQATTDAQKAHTDAAAIWAKEKADLQSWNQRMFESAGNILAKFGGTQGQEEKPVTPADVAAKYKL